MKLIMENWKRYLEESPKEKTQVSQVTLSDKNTAIFAHWGSYTMKLTMGKEDEAKEILRSKLIPALKLDPKTPKETAMKILKSRDSAEVKRLLGIPEDPVSDK